MNDMKSTKPKQKTEPKATVLAGVENRPTVFIPGRGAIEATSLEEAIEKLNEEEETDGNN